MANAGTARPDWLFLLRPKWLCWHAFAVVATLGMLWLGDWQLHRAESGNELSWAYTFEWPIFAVCGVLFWAKSLRDEIGLRAAGPDEDTPAVASGDLAAGTDGELAASQPGGQAGEYGPAEGDAYLARLQAEVRGHGKWHGWR
jgi:hypothetical protein